MRKYALAILIGLQVGITLVCNVITLRQFPLFGISMPYAVLIFPIMFAVSDVIQEIYGYRASRIASWCAVIMGLFMAGAFTFVASFQPMDDWFRNLGADSHSLGALGAVAASFIAYLISGWLNDIIFDQLYKRLPTMFGVRAIVSTAIAQAIDSTIYIGLAFGIGWVVKLPHWHMIVLFQWIMKTGIAAVLLPSVHACVMKLPYDVREETRSYSIFG